MRILAASMFIVSLLRCPNTQQQVPAHNAPMKASESAAITITGVVTREGVECPAVRGDDGKLYTVVGAGREKLKPGVRVKITGAVAEMSTCMQGITINATNIDVLTANVTA